MDVLEQLRGVVKEYEGGPVAVDGASLDVREGETLAIVGPNGAGKTTLLRIMAMLDEPSSGDVFYRGIRVTSKNRKTLRKKITMIFQRTTIFDATVHENVAYGLKVRGYPREVIEEKVSDALELLDMWGHSERQAKNLSGGEQQGVALARALVLDPELLLLDEPMLNLDPPHVVRVENLVKEIKGNVTMVHATHDLSRAVRLADRVAIMNNGAIVQVGTADDVFSRPKNDFVARFVGFENVFRGKIVASEGGMVRILLDNVVEIEAISDKHGSRIVGIRPEDIIVSSRRLKSSARNVFRGKIVDHVNMGALAKLVVDVDGSRFKALVTRRSFIDMGLKRGRSIYLTFKASCIHVI